MSGPFFFSRRAVASSEDQGEKADDDEQSDDKDDADRAANELEHGFPFASRVASDQREAEARGSEDELDRADQFGFKRPEHVVEIVTATENASIHTHNGILALPSGQLGPLLDPVERMLG